MPIFLKLTVVPKVSVRILEYPSKSFSFILKPEAAVRRCSVKKVFVKNFHVYGKKPRAEVLFLKDAG